MRKERSEEHGGNKQTGKKGGRKFDAKQQPPKKKMKSDKKEVIEIEEEYDLHNVKALSPALTGRVKTCIFRVKGPIPDEPDLGMMFLEKRDLADVTKQGSMISGCATTAYFNHLVRSYHLLGVRRTGDTFMHDLTQRITKTKTPEAAFSSFSQELKERMMGSHTIDFENDPLILIQVFVGDPQCGHWSLLVIDRTQSADVVVYFDSMRSFGVDTFVTLQGKLRGTPFAADRVTWIYANQFQQGRLTNDCGIAMCCTAAAYVNGRLAQGCLDVKRPGRTDLICNEVVTTLASSVNAFSIGVAGRQHMLSCFNEERFIQNDSLFNNISINWL